MDNENTFTHWMIGRQFSSLGKWNYEIRRQMNVARNSHPGRGNPERQTVHAFYHMWMRALAVCFSLDLSKFHGELPLHPALKSLRQEDILLEVQSSKAACAKVSSRSG